MPRKMIVEIRPAILKPVTGPAVPFKPKPAVSGCGRQAAAAPANTSRVRSLSTRRLETPNRPLPNPPRQRHLTSRQLTRRHPPTNPLTPKQPQPVVDANRYRRSSAGTAGATAAAAAAAVAAAQSAVASVAPQPSSPRRNLLRPPTRQLPTSLRSRWQPRRNQRQPFRHRQHSHRQQQRCPPPPHPLRPRR